MLLTDLTPEEREVYRTAFALSVATDIPFADVLEAEGSARSRAMLAVMAWRRLLERQAKELEERNAENTR